MPLRPIEAFLLSRTDGATNEHELSLLTGLSVVEVEAALNRLYDLGAIDFVRGQRGEGPSAAPVPPQATAPPRAASAHARPAAPLPPSQGSDTIPAPPPPGPRRLYDPAELDEDVELDFDRKQRVLDVFHRLNDLSHYELLRVDRSADKKRIKAAYYQLAPEFHTDSYFGKRLGSYKAKIEAIFSRVTLAHDVLAHPKRRAAYDLELSLINPEPESLSSLTSAPASAPMSAPVSASASVPVSAPVSAAPPFSGEIPVSGASPVSGSASTMRDDGELGAESARARRSLLAKKLASPGTRR